MLDCMVRRILQPIPFALLHCLVFMGACQHDWDTYDPRLGRVSGAGAGGGDSTGSGGVMVSSASTGAGGQPPVEGFSYRRRLVFNNGNRNEELRDFPVLVSLDASRIDYSKVKAGGADIRFFDAQGAALPYEIERWQPSGTSVVWVRVPRIGAGSTTDAIFLHYGNPMLDHAQEHEAVWADYQAVYHLDNTLQDSSPNHFHATNGGSSSASFIGEARSFSGNGSVHVDAGKNRPFLQSASAFTLSAWVRPSATFTNQGVIFGASIYNNGNPSTSSRGQIYIQNNLSIRCGARTNDTSPIQELIGGQTPRSTWTWVSFVADFSNKSMALYVNGVPAGSKDVTAFDASTPNTPSGSATIGLDEDYSSLAFDGDIDEVTLTLRAWSAAWISAQFASMSDTFITYGAEESL